MEQRNPAHVIVRERCASLQLSIEHAERLSAVSGYVGSKALFWTIGLDFATLKELKPRDWLRMAAQNCSVSYACVLDSPGLLAILTSGVVPDNFLSHVMHLLDETPIQTVVLAAEQASRQSGAPLAQIWANLARFASDLGAHRKGAWSPKIAVVRK